MSFASQTRPNERFRMFSGWRSLTCWLCIGAMSMPTAMWLPLNLLQQFRLASEEEVHTAGPTVAENREERRNPPPRPVRRVRWSNRSGSSRWHSSGPSIAGRGEFRFLNGTGARLLC